MNLTVIFKLSILTFIIFNHSLQARVQVYPLRVFLDQRNQGQEITVRNMSSQAGSYRINTVFFVQDENGQMSLLDENQTDSLDLRDYIRFSPRVVQLGPGESQTVRLFVRNTANLTPGDYRAHLRFEQTLESFQQNLEETQESAPNTIQTGLEARIAVSIPVYYRRGNPEYEVNLSNLEVNINKEKIEDSRFSVILTRSGNGIPYGRFSLYVQEGDEKTLIGVVNGAQSFLDERRFRYPISDIEEHQALLSSKENKFFVLEFESTRSNEENIRASTKIEM